MSCHTIITPYNPRWKADYEAVREMISAELGENLAAVYHIGSTAVEGLSASPVIDVMAVMPDETAKAAAAARLSGVPASGAAPALETCPGITAADGFRLYIFSRSQGMAVRGRLAFRDYLRSHPDEAQAYGEFKAKLASAGGSEEQKKAYIEKLQQKAFAWRLDAMTREEQTLEIIDGLKGEYPGAECTLDYNQAWKLLVSVRLAAQCTDARVNEVVKDLYAKFPDVRSLAAAGVEDIERIVKPCGLGHSKARDISACMKILENQYGGNVPDDFDALLKLPGVGRKSANLIMGDVFGKPAIVTDTHCIRLVNRMGLVDGIKEPKKVEMALWKLVPPEEGSDFCHRLVYHGREVCTARTAPHCDRCCVRDLCRRCGVEEK